MLIEAQIAIVSKISLNIKAHLDTNLQIQTQFPSIATQQLLLMEILIILTKFPQIKTQIVIAIAQIKTPLP